MIPGSANALLLGSAAGGYEIERSLRFNSADSAYLSRTPASAGNRKTWTWAGWVKLGKLGSTQRVFKAADTYLSYYATSGTLYTNLRGAATNYFISYANVYRDPSAWYHVVLAVDTTQSTAADRQKLYVNGTQVTASGPLGQTYPPQNDDTGVNSSSNQHQIAGDTVDSLYFDGCLADLHFCDGTAYDASAFGEFDSNGIWQPKKFAGVYGSQGWHLDFADNSAATAAALGKDTSGNGNNWTPNNLSVTAGAGNDSLVDSPTNGTASSGGDAGGVVVGNYATLNPLKTVSYVLSNGNLDFSQPASGSGTVATVAIPFSGKWYWEITPTHSTGEYFYGVIGEPSVGANLTTASQPSNFVMAGYAGGDGRIYKNSYTAIQTGLPYRATGYVWGIAVDVDANTIQFYVNGATYGSAVSTALTAGVVYLPWISSGNNSGATHTGSANFGARPFAYAAPAGFKSLNTANLPTPTILKGSDYFDTKLYTGNGSTQTISGLGFSPDLVWGKERGGTASHVWMDVIRGTGVYLRSDTTNGDSSNVNVITSFNADGFDLGTSSALNGNTNPYAAWCWDAGTSTVTNTQGSITSTVRANASAGFSIVTYTGTGVDGSVGHGLGVAPVIYFVKNRSASSNWAAAYTIVDGSLDFMYLNLTNAAGNATQSVPTSTVINLQQSAGETTNGNNYVIYAFAPVAGYSSFGSYTGNGSADGPFVYTGFRPRWVIIKCTSAGGSNFDWFIYDTARDTFNASYRILTANSSGAETVATGGTYTDMFIDILSTGFKVKTNYQSHNNNTSTYIYAAFAENPFSIARAR